MIVGGIASVNVAAIRMIIPSKVGVKKGYKIIAPNTLLLYPDFQLFPR